ncbi:hypothetical protein O0I10_010897 [Lichtheimia ornata]|uniref:Uncharacterized protein n=1 Tax=Lichtheimia ornata TaxID=688661 RepID=A0AAD7UUS0_9FUNG|nr:uncharacterized protein O0I10_010897 [Lichtheimia ornata]KAJ8653461.1 hypothetical protein O0I10_010897 [Lichtheimia ornata]
MSSANSIKSPDKETGTQSSTPPISYARAARVQRPTAIRESLTSNALDKTTHSNVWKVGGSPASCPSLFDFTSRTENRSTLLRHISESYPDNCVARLHSDHSRRIVELFIDDSSLYEKACKNGSLLWFSYLTHSAFIGKRSHHQHSSQQPAIHI